MWHIFGKLLFVFGAAGAIFGLQSFANKLKKLINLYSILYILTLYLIILILTYFYLINILETNFWLDLWINIFAPDPNPYKLI